MLPDGNKIQRTNFSPSQPDEAFDVGQKHVEAKSVENGKMCYKCIMLCLNIFTIPHFTFNNNLMLSCGQFILCFRPLDVEQSILEDSRNCVQLSSFCKNFDNLSESDEGSVVDEETPISEVVDEVQNNSQAVVDSSPAPVLEEAPKKSYASIVKVMKENATAPFLAPSARPAPVIPSRQTPTVATSSPAPEVPASGSHGAESGDVQEAE
ncbi:hypothetical protein Taro_038581, partial [Colocasia esculenta]|nr:hypothetical protein [Colocasia esculenta]